MPDTPPVAPGVISDQPSVGLGTQAGLVATAILGIAAIVTAILNGDHSTETVASLAGAVVTLCTTIGGRMAQAAAALRAVGPTIEAAAGGLRRTP
jgi:hypothetical protein